MILAQDVSYPGPHQPNAEEYEEEQQYYCEDPDCIHTPELSHMPYSAARLRYEAAMEFERARLEQLEQLPSDLSVQHLVSIVDDEEEGEHQPDSAHSSTFEMLSRAASTLTHPTTWASNVLSLVSASVSAAHESGSSSSSSGTESDCEDHTAHISSAVPLVTCITPPMLTLTEYTGFTTEVTMTRRLSLSELSAPPYAPWPPRQSRTILCASAAAAASRTIARGDSDPLRFMLPWTMDKRFMFPLPLDHQGRASFRSGRWWSRRNLGYDYVRPAAVQYIMRRKGVPIGQEETGEGDETLPTGPDDSIAASTTVLSIREAALAIARAGHEQAVLNQQHSLGASSTSLHRSLRADRDDHALAHCADSDSDMETETEWIQQQQQQQQQSESTQARVHRPSPRPTYCPGRMPSIRGRSSSLRCVAVSGAEASQENPGVSQGTGGSSRHRRFFARRWRTSYNGEGESQSGSEEEDAPSSSSSTHSYQDCPLDSLSSSHDDISSEASDDSSSSLSFLTSDRCSDTSDEGSDDSDEVDACISASGLDKYKQRVQLLGTVFEEDLFDEDGDDCVVAKMRETRMAVLQHHDRTAALRRSQQPASFYPASLSPEHEDEIMLIEDDDDDQDDSYTTRRNVRKNPAANLLQRTRRIEDVQAHLKMPSMHSTVARHAASAAAATATQLVNDDAEAPAAFASAVLARPVPTVYMPVSSTVRGGVRAVGPLIPTRSVFLDASCVMDWEPQAV
ncbi:hypothetical protein V8E36_004720 [Tilletia maclaganii]